jgi:hypothetical protein
MTPVERLELRPTPEPIHDFGSQVHLLRRPVRGSQELVDQFRSTGRRRWIEPLVGWIREEAQNEPTLEGDDVVGRRGKGGVEPDHVRRCATAGHPHREARIAIAKPAKAQGVDVTEDALARIVEQTHGYPHFLQEWGKHAWDTADASPITRDDVERASTTALAALDESFFRVRFARLTPLEKRYLRAMAQLGPGPHRSGDIADELGRKVTSLGPTRNQLIAKGMVWSPSHGDTAFTVPLFDEFMSRIMPGNDWRTR